LQVKHPKIPFLKSNKRAIDLKKMINKVLKSPTQPTQKIKKEKNDFFSSTIPAKHFI
jgi:hypothetical protein